ncbi:MAG: hypothetical protein OXR66_02215 [Candidatus Woesearchaeota archaeon]|nr:hypothetical protein [Candidatus Woesearchaeota archaeon]
MFVILLVLYCVFFLGHILQQHVPDEVQPAQKYLVLAADVLLLVVLGLALHMHNHIYAAFIVPVILICVRYWLSYDWVYAPLSGIALATEATPVLLLCLILNYLVGMLEGDRMALFSRTIAQPVIAGTLVVLL